MSLLNSLQGFGNNPLLQQLQGQQDSPAGASMTKALQQLQGQGVEGLSPDALQGLAKGDLNSLSKQGLDFVNQLKPSQETAGPVATPNLGMNRAPTFGDMIRGLVDHVDAKDKASAEETRKLMTGESDNLHQAMIASQEASVAFSLLVEVRNKLVTAYQELSRMSV